MPWTIMTKAEGLFCITQCFFILYLQHKYLYYDSIGQGMFCLFMQVPVTHSRLSEIKMKVCDLHSFCKSGRTLCFKGYANNLFHFK